MDESKDITFNESLDKIRNFINNSQDEKAFLEIKKRFSIQNSYYQASTLKNFLDKTKIKSDVKIKIAFGGKCTLNPIAELLEFCFKLSGVSVETYLCQFGTIQQEILNTKSELYKFKPDFILIINSAHDLDFIKGQKLTKEQTLDLVKKTSEEIKDLATHAQSKTSAQIIVSNFDTPAVRTYSNYERQVETSEGQIFTQLNNQIDKISKNFFSVLDLNFLSEQFGKAKWTSTRFWYEGKYPFNLEAAPTVAFAAFRLIESIMGKSKKCLVMDLDNTIWGGVVGDDGALAVNMSLDNSIGEAFSDLQKFILSLKNRGILLAVCSKNEEALAKEVFLKNTNMILKLEDIAVFKANWKNKAENIKEIATELNIGLDSLVFLDDSVFERNLVRELLPQVEVVELSDDPADFKGQLAEKNYFEMATMTEEDLKRSQMYQQEKLRTFYKSEVKTEEEYLQNLKMVATVSKITDSNKDRCVQLINKSNQYNLLKSKITHPQMDAKTKDSNVIVYAFSLSDRFGDNGIVSVASVIKDNASKTLEIDCFVMSCRVLMRGLEDFIHQHICKIATGLGFEKIKGKIIKTEKNKISQNHFEKLNFTCIENNENESIWLFDLKTQATFVAKHFIATNDD